jgi:hypothetical protein
MRMNKTFPSPAPGTFPFARADYHRLHGWPDYQPPKTQAPPAWSGVSNSTTAADTRLTSNAVELAQWWTGLKTPS